MYDPVGGSAFQEALKVAKWGAQILIIGFASGTIPKVTCLSRSLYTHVKNNLQNNIGMMLVYEESTAMVCVQVAANIALVKNLTLHGVFWGSYMQHKPSVLQKSLQELVSWWAEGKISIPVSHRSATPQQDPIKHDSILMCSNSSLL